MILLNLIKQLFYTTASQPLHCLQVLFPLFQKTVNFLVFWKTGLWLCSYTSLKHMNSFQHTRIHTRVFVQWQRLWLMICKDLICCKEDVTQTTKELHTSACIGHHKMKTIHWRSWTFSANLLILADFATFLCRNILPLKDNISSNSLQQSIYKSLVAYRGHLPLPSLQI